MRVRRVLGGAAFLLAVVLVAVAVVSYVTTQRPLPDLRGEVQIDALGADVSVMRDEWGIPQIYADTEEDLFLAQGYVHAQDRFYEMDFRRHVTAGRLAELVGGGAVETDAFVRTLGWRRVAEQEWSLLDDRTQDLLRAYARGVNAYIEDRSGPQLSLEYSVLGLTGPDYQPEPWTPVDSIAWVKAMAWDLRSNMADEIERTLATEKLSTDEVERLWPAYPSEHPTIVDSDDLAAGPGPAPAAPAAADVVEAVASVRTAADAAEALPALLGTGDGIGSNSWVLGGEHTTTGEPILANDPHLAPSMPGIWYQNGLHCRDLGDACRFDVAGYSFSGMPGVVVGHNRDVAWGVTTMYADVADLYLERVEGDSYEYEGEQVPLETRREVIEVAGGEDRTITVRETRHGPLLSDLDEQLARVGDATVPGVERGTYEVALQWTALTPRPTIEAVFALGAARDWESFRDAAEQFTVPSQNLVYADTEGNIGYQAPGAIPVRSRGDGRWPVPGWTGTHEWTGEIPFDELPSVLNPDEGWIVTANNQVVDGAYRYRLGEDTAEGYRAARITELLETQNIFSVDDMVRLQMDEEHPLADTLVPVLEDVLLDDPFHQQGRETLEGWNGQMSADSAAAAYFAAVWRHLVDLAFADELPEDQAPDGGSRWFAVVDEILDDRTDPLWDVRTTPGVTEERDDVLAEAMRRATDELTRRIARDPQAWSWGRLHRLELVNATLGESGIAPIEALFNRGPFEVGGGSGIVNATGWDAAEGYGVTAVPSMRMVVDLAELDASRWIQLTGNSGHAFSDNYVDQAPLWARGETLPWAFSAQAVREAATHTLTLRAP